VTTPPGCFYIDRDVPLGGVDALMGYAVLDDAVVLGTVGLAAFRAARPGVRFHPVEGRFAVLTTEGSEFVVRTDITGQEVVYAYLAEDFWAASNSFAMVIAGVARHRRLALYPPAIMGFHLKGGTHIGEQLLSHRTMVEWIEVLPAAAELRIDRATRRARVVRRSLADALPEEGHDYEASLVDFVERSSGALAALARHAPGTHCQLSGGYDSRLALALLLAGTGPGAIAVESFPDREQDFRLARAICEALGLRLNAPQPGGSTLDGEASLAVWELASLGVYLPIYPIQNLSTPPGAHLRVTGDLAADWKYFRGTARFNGDAAKVARDIRGELARRPHGREVAEDFLSVFREMDIDPAAPWAMEIYYSLMRSRFHCGRHWYRELGHNRLATPLVSARLVRLEMLAAEHGWDRRRICCDILLAADPRLARFPFDRTDKRFPADLLDASPFRRGCTVRPRPFEVFAGDPGPPAVGQAPARRSTYRRDAFVAAFRDRFAGIARQRLTAWFTADDFARADAEVAEVASLSHGLRRATHVCFVAGIMDLIAS
jgi:hypothetical protein